MAALADNAALNIAPSTSPSVAGINPVPMSFPAFLRNPSLSGRLAHLREETTQVSHSVHLKKRRTRDDRDGKRWIRRQENARFVHNPHIVHASKKDLVLQLPHLRPTFPIPLPPYLPRGVPAPSACLPVQNANSANSGRFSLGLKGMRRDLRRSGARAERLVKEIEAELLEWLAGGTMLLPDGGEQDELCFPGRLIGSYANNEPQNEDAERHGIWEVSRTPLRLVWAIESDAFTRYIAHCCARYHSVVSFSKDVSGHRLTYFLRPNVTRPDFFARSLLDTPPATDIDYSSHASTVNSGAESDAASVISIGIGSVLEEESEEDASGRLSPANAHAAFPETARRVDEPHFDEGDDVDENGRTPRPRHRRNPPRFRSIGSSSPTAEADDELVLSESMRNIQIDVDSHPIVSEASPRLRLSRRVNVEALDVRIHNTHQRESSPSASPVHATRWPRAQKRSERRPHTLYDYLYS